VDLSPLRTRLTSAVDLARGLVPVARAGIVRPMRPSRLAGVAGAWVRWDLTPGGLLSICARRAPGRTAVVDDAGSLTYAELDASVSALARSLQRRGIGERSRVAVLCRNHRGVLQVLGATGRLGADLVLLNTGLSAGQLADVVSEQGVELLVADGEFADVVPSGPDAPTLVQAWGPDEGPGLAAPTLAELVACAPDGPLPTRPRRGRTVVLTSGTTGTPKGAHRPEPRSWLPAAAVLSRIPLRSGRTTVVAAPVFHTWGFAALQLSLALGSTVVLRRRFDAATVLTDVQTHHADALFVVPVMLQRIVELPPAERAHDTSSLRVVAASGSALGVPLVRRVLAQLGPVLYNLYGSTEVSWVSIATPEELAAAPSTAGRPPLGTRLAVLDEDGEPVAAGTVGRVFVGNGMLFEGYTRAGDDKEVLDGLMSTGDLGHVDTDGLLHLDGRSDDMVVSGGENVYPGEVEDVIAAMDGVREVKVVGVPDERFGARLAAYVVGDGVDPDAVRAHVRQHLARFSVPRDVVLLDGLPRNATGKVVARELPRSTGGP
jgi:fatty-acyl-CoA synthase